MENVYFLISLATIIEPKYYKAEFKLVKKLLNELFLIYDIFL